MLEIIQNVRMDNINHTVLDEKSQKSIILVVTERSIHECDNTVHKRYAGIETAR